jgi:hypothetical protein
MVQTPRLAFRDPALHTCQIERTAMNQPRVWSGQFAVVYKAVDAQGKPRAVRAFTSESRSRREHYDCISAHLKTCRLKCLVEFEYVDPGIRSAGDGKWYPLVVMDWVEGMTLFEWVASKCRAGKGGSITKAIQHWLRLIDELAGARIAHGDLQHANVLVTPRGYLKLVGYDGMCVPALAGRPNLELGVKPYQHPQRDPQTLLSETAVQHQVCRVILEIQTGSGPCTTLVLDRPTTIIAGRGEDCQVRIANDPRVSRRHFLLQISPPRIRLCDLGSYNGTKVNGVTYRSTSSVAPGAQPTPSLAEVNLRHGDRIVVGRTVIQVLVENVNE